MAEQEIIKHVKAAVAISRDRKKKWQHKLLDILLEVAIIVFAVSLSIWLHNWSESRKDNSEEREFLTGLRQDLLADIQEMDSDLGGLKTEYNGIKYFERVGAGEPLNKDSLTAYEAMVFTSVAQINPRISRFEALKGSGRMSIIGNKELLLNITDFYTKDFPRIVRRNDFFNSLKQNTLMQFMAAHLQLDAQGKGTNWQEMLGMSQLRVMLTLQEMLLSNIEAYADGIGRCRKIVGEIDEELR
jgi:hypothetical protein